MKDHEAFAGAQPIERIKDNEDIGTRRLARWTPWLALGGYICLTAIAMWPALSDWSNTIMGAHQPGDATAYGISGAWQLLTLPAFAAHTPYLAFPRGGAFWDVTYATKFGWLLPQWLFAAVVGPVASWNIVDTLAFIADGMAMFGLVKWLTRRDWIAFVAGVLYAFSPFHVEESYAHVAYVASWIFPLVLWAGLALLQRPSWRRGVAFGLFVAASAYIDAYYIVFAVLLAVLLVIAGLMSFQRLGLQLRELLRTYAAAAGAAFLALLPLGIYYESAPVKAPELAAQARVIGGVTAYSARLWEYFTPWSASPLWGWLFTPLVHRWLFPVTSVETSLYLGVVVLALALAPVWVALIRLFSPQASRLRAGGKVFIDDALDSPIPAAFTARLLLTLAGILALCSVAWFGPLPGFPVVLYHLKPYWRTFTRMDVVVDCLVIVAAALTLSVLARSRRRWVAPVIALLALADGTAFFPWSSWSYAANTPAPFRWLATHQNGGVVANYPLPESGYTAGGLALTFQPFNHHPLFNGSEQYSPHGELEYGLADIADPQTVPTLRRIGVKYIVLDRYAYFGVHWRDTHISGVRLIVHKNGQYLYQIEPGPLLPAALTDMAGFPLTKPFLPRIERYMNSSSAKLGIHVFQRGVPLRIAVDLRSWKRNRFVAIYQHGVLLWEGEVGNGARMASFTTRSGDPLHISCKPGPTLEFLHGAYPPLRARTVDVTRLKVTRA